jgi:hypothetical protein
MKIAIMAVMILHGTIHSLGFIKAFRVAELSQLSHPIPKLYGVLWLLAGLLFIFAAILFSIERQWWWMLSVTSVVISQYLIVNDWEEAKFGTVANVIVLLASIIGFIVWTMAKN